MNENATPKHEISRWNLKNQISILEHKRKDIKKDIQIIESSFNGGLAVEAMEYEAIVLKVIRILNERLHHACIMFASDDSMGYRDFSYDGGNIIYTVTYADDDEGLLIHSIEEPFESFSELYNSCVQKIIDDELDEDIKLFLSALRFHCDEVVEQTDTRKGNLMNDITILKKDSFKND